jgi:hypothetical protein
MLACTPARRRCGQVGRRNGNVAASGACSNTGQREYCVSKCQAMSGNVRYQEGYRCSKDKARKRSAVKGNLQLQSEVAWTHFKVFGNRNEDKITI